MELFIGNLPPGVGSAGFRSVFLPSRMIRSAEVVQFHDHHGAIHRYGRITLASGFIGTYAVRIMGKLRWPGTRLTVRKFHHRAAGNERRALNWRIRHWGGIERRLRERRTFSESVLTGTPVRCADRNRVPQPG